MELDILKLHTTWNDAANSINTNFSKIQMAIASLGMGSGGLNEDELRNFLVAYLSQNGYATKEDIEAAILNIVDGAPSSVDTFKDVSDALNEIDSVINSLASTVNNKVSKEELASELLLYATESFVTSQGYITSDALAPYIKESVADERYATIVNLNGVSSRVKTLEDAGFALAKDVEASVAGINVELAKKATIDALNEGLNDRYTKKNVDDLFSNFKGTENITTLGTITKGVWNGTAIANEYLANSKITISGIEVALGGSISQAALRKGLGLDAILAWYESVGVKFQKQSDDTIYVDGNLVTGGQFAAMTAGEGSGSIGATNLSDLFDVSVSALTSGDLLSWNGSEWVNIKKSTLAPDLSAYATKSFVTSQGYITSAALASYATKNDVTTALLPYATAETVNKVAGRVKTLEEAGYATEAFVTSRGYITSTALSPYITKDTADSSYATIDGLDGLNSRLTAIEDYFYTVDDADAKIDKWNEIVAFLDATEGTTLAGILAVYETKENIANTLKSYATTASLNTLAGRVTTLEGKATAVSFSPSLTSGKQIGVLTIDGEAKNLYAPSMYDWSEINAKPTKLSDFTDDVVAGKYQPLATAINTSNIGEQMVGYAQRAESAVDSETLGGLAPEMYAKNLNNATGINIDDTTFIGLRGGKTFAASGTFGYDGYSPFLEFGADGYTVQMQGRDGAFYARTCENKIWGNWKTLLHSDNISDYVHKSGIKWEYETSATWNVIEAGTNQGIRVLNTIGESSTGAPSDYAVGLAVSGHYGFILAYDASNRNIKVKNSHSDNWNILLDSGYFEQYVGENVITKKYYEGNSMPPLNGFGLWNGVGGYMRLGALEEYSIGFRVSSGILQSLVTHGSTEGEWKTLIHEGNYSSYALPLTGGTISNGLVIASGYDNKLTLNNTDSESKYQLISFQQNGVEYGSLGTAGNNDLMWNFYTIIHSGNIAYQAVGAVKEYEVLDFVNQESATIRGWHNWGNPTGTSFANYTHGIVATSLDGNVYHYLGFANAEANPRVRSFSYGADSGWKTIAFVDDNVASATKLQTARSLWGNSFDGTRDVDGDMSLNISRIYWLSDNNNYSINCENNGVMYYRAYYGHSFYSGRTELMRIATEGNVIIGATTIAQNGITTNEITIGGVRIYVEDGALKINGNVFAVGQLASGV